jgi:hypothetical protein
MARPAAQREDHDGYREPKRGPPRYDVEAARAEFLLLPDRCHVGIVRPQGPLGDPIRSIPAAVCVRWRGVDV